MSDPALRPVRAPACSPNEKRLNRNAGDNGSRALDDDAHLGQLIGRAGPLHAPHAELFEDGNLDEALRHAIPLGGESLGQAFGTPTAPTDLTLSTGRAAGANLNIGDTLEQHLRSLYRKAFEARL